MKAFMIKWLLSTVMDLLIKGLRDLCNKSDNTVDDKVVTVIADNKDAIMDEIKKRI